jgi:hypothetical protein
MIRKRYIVVGSMLGGVVRIGLLDANTHPAHAHAPASTSAARAIPSTTPAAASAQPLFAAELTAWDDGAGWSGWLSGPASIGTDMALGDCANAAADLDVANGRFSSWLPATQTAAS